MRLQLAVPTEPRDAPSLAKDSLLNNCYIDRDPSALYIVKRPGMILSSSTPTRVEGIFFTNGILYYIDTSFGSFPVRTV